MPWGNPLLKNPQEVEGGREPGHETFRRGAALVLLSLGSTAAVVKRDSLDCRMNFAAQLLYSSYLSERLQRLYSPRPALKDTEENDPFWQRWELHLNSPGIFWEFLPKPCSHQRSDLLSQGFDVSFCLQLEFQKLLINVFFKVIHPKCFPTPSIRGSSTRFYKVKEFKGMVV